MRRRTVSTSRLVAEHFKQDGRPKRAFDTRRQARAFLHPSQLDLYRVYRCGFCNKFHLATKKG